MNRLKIGLNQVRQQAGKSWGYMCVCVCVFVCVWLTDLLPITSKNNYSIYYIKIWSKKIMISWQKKFQNTYRFTRERSDQKSKTYKTIIIFFHCLLPYTSFLIFYLFTIINKKGIKSCNLMKSRKLINLSNYNKNKRNKSNYFSFHFKIGVYL